MKPVIEKQNFHHVMLTRDDKEVFAFTIKNSFLTFVITFFILLLLAGAGGVFFGLNSWNKISALDTKYEETSEELVKAKLQLEELKNVQSLIAVDSPSPFAISNEISDLHSSIPANSTFATGSLLSALNSTLVAGAASVIPLDSDDIPIKIESFQGRVINNSALRINFDLIAVEPEHLIQGVVKFTAMLTNSTIKEMTAQYPEDARFAISRMKNFDTIIRFHDETSTDTIKHILLTITTTNGTTYQNEFPISR